MPFVLILIGVLIMVAAIRDQLGALGALLKGDFSGPGNFLYWLVALIILGGIGYVSPLTKTSRSLLALVIIVMFLSDRGFVAQFTAALNEPAPPAASEAAVGSAVPDTGGAPSGGGSSASGGLLGTAEGLAGSAIGNAILPGVGGAIGGGVAKALGGIL